MTADRSDDAPFADWDLESSRSLESFPPASLRVRPPRSATRAAAGEATMDLNDPGDATGMWSHRSSDPTAGDRSGKAAAPKLPDVGAEAGGFALIAELGRGAFARVFLAREASLGGRLTALKVSAAEGDEPRTLARLQHANIVPVYSVRDDPASGLRFLCMPYLGGANLERVLQESTPADGGAGRGRSLIDALDLLSRRVSASASLAESVGRSRRPSTSRDGAALRIDHPEGDPRSAAAPGGVDRPSRRFAPAWLSGASQAADDGEVDRLPSRRFLRDADRNRAAAWIVAQLAEGLEHAHQRGLLHRDLKPSNVLITAEGTPMLLDFNLAVEAAADGDEADGPAARAMLGGTLPYMAPEHLDALDPAGATPPEAVDARSDLYSLGLILFELIAGEPAFPTPDAAAGGVLAKIRGMRSRRLAGAPSLRTKAPPSLAALVAKCLDPAPAKRFRSAGDLADDLRRFLDDLPMKHGPEPSLRERAAKWVRRHPSICSSSTVAVAGICVAAAILFGSWRIFGAMQELHARLKLRSFATEALECRFLLNTFGDPGRVGIGLDKAAATLDAAGTDEAGGVLGGPWIERLAERERAEVKRSIVDLVLQSVHARVVLTRRASDATRRDALEEAVARLDRLEKLADDPPAVLYRRRARYRAALGDGVGAAADRHAAAARPPATSEDWTALGMVQLADGDTATAEESLRRAVEADVSAFWPWFALGHCHFEQGRHADAVADFTACVVARPDFAWGHFNRGLALARAGRPREARDAYSRALALDPGFAEARADRGLVELELSRPDRAEADLRGAADLGRREPRLLAALADALVRQGKTDEAERLFDDLLARAPSPDIRAARGMVRLTAAPDRAADDFRAALAEDSEHAVAHYGMARVVRDGDRAAALDHLDRAIATDPELYEAVELRALERARQGDRGALDDVERLVARPTPNRLYNAACALAILGDASRAVDLLGRAVLSGFPASLAATDPDLASLRGRRDFAAAVAREPAGE